VAEGLAAASKYRSIVATVRAKCGFCSGGNASRAASNGRIPTEAMMAYREDIIDRLWRKARAVSGRDARQWRKDQCGAWIFRPHYGNNATEHGWKVEKHCGGRGRRDREPAALSPR
jgi:hypothetical protein